MTVDSNSRDSEPSAWETLNSTQLMRNPWFTLRQDQVRLPSGKVLDDFYIWEHPDWVNVIAVTANREIVLVQQYRHGLRQTHCELPGGIRGGRGGLQDRSGRTIPPVHHVRSRFHAGHRNDHPIDRRRRAGIF